MVTTRQVRDWWHEYRCDYGTPTNMFGRSPVYAQNTSWVRALEQAHYGAGYQPTPGGFIGSKRNCPSGIGGKTCQESGDNCSLHNYGLAWDVEYQYNRHLWVKLNPTELQILYDTGVTKYNPAIVATILDVRNTRGDRLFRWLGYPIGDLMHWQIAVPPERQQVDWGTVPTTEGEGMLREGSTGINVKKWQNYLNRWVLKYPGVWPPLTEDAEYGSKTGQRTVEFQTWANIDPTGTVGFFDVGTMAIAIEAQ